MPLFIAVGRGTASGGEHLAYDLQALGRAIVIGQPTLGAAHRVAEFDVAGSLLLTVPAGKVINPITGTDWEGCGVVPTVLVADDVDVRLLALERAVAARRNL